MRDSKILFFSEGVNYRIQGRKDICIMIRKIIKSEKKKEGDINIIMCTDKKLLETNKRFLKHDYYTDIITFNYNTESIISGDIFISMERIRENAKTFNNRLNNEIKRVIIHGILHLCGYDDRTNRLKKEMTEKEDYYLNS